MRVKDSEASQTIFLYFMDRISGNVSQQMYSSFSHVIHSLSL